MLAWLDMPEDRGALEKVVGFNLFRSLCREPQSLGDAVHK